MCFPTEYKYIIEIGEYKDFILKYNFTTLSEARTEAIKKANEIYNERKV